MKKRSVLGDKRDSLFRTTDERSPDIVDEKTEETPQGETSDEGKRVSIVLYDNDIQFLEESLYKLKMRGFRSASKSKIIRFALDQIRSVDIDDYAIK